MKYSIEGFSQEKLVEQGLDCRDAVFLRWFVDFQATDQMKIHVEDSNVYYWIDHATVIQELPILGRSTPDSVGKYIKQLIDKGVLEKHLVRRGQDKGTEVYYRIVPALIYECTTNKEEHPHDRASTPPVQMGGSDSSTTIIQEEEGEEPILPLDDSSKKEGVYQTLVDAARVYGKVLALSSSDKQRIQAAVDVWTTLAVCEAWTDWLEAGKKMSIRFFCEDTDFAKYRTKTEAVEQKLTCPNCGRDVKPWEVSESVCVHCLEIATEEQAGEMFDTLRRRLSTRR
jgi:Zn finger protein HypA/HybF involved in hydrogenase expression